MERLRPGPKSRARVDDRRPEWKPLIAMASWWCDALRNMAAKRRCTIVGAGATWCLPDLDGAG
jgi:hypothetical protein